MAIPAPADLMKMVIHEPDTAETFLAKLIPMLADTNTVRNGYRSNGNFSFYVPGVMLTAAQLEVTKQLKDAGYEVKILEQIVGFMPTNLIVDFRSAASTDIDVTGPSTFPWFHVQLHVPRK